LQRKERIAADPVPAVDGAWISFGIVDQQMDAIGADTSDQGELLGVSALVPGQPTMREQLERTVISLDHDQRFANLATVLQLKIIY
jgi:hypothetical protein